MTPEATENKPLYQLPDMRPFTPTGEMTSAEQSDAMREFNHVIYHADSSRVSE